MVSPVYVWNVLSGKLERMIDGHTKGFSSVSFSPDGKTLLGKESGFIGDNLLWDVSTGTVKRECFVPYAVFSPNSQTLAIGGGSLFRLSEVFKCLIKGISPMNNGAIWLLDMLNNTQKRTLIGHKGYITSISFSPDGKMLASADRNGDIRLWDVLKGKTKKKLRGYSVLFSPDGQTLASGCEGNIHLWDLLTRKVKKILTGHRNGFTCMMFSPDNQTLVSIDSNDHSIWLWDVLTGTVKLELTGTNGSGENVSFSPDGKTLASGSGKTSIIHLSDVSTGTVKEDFVGHTNSVWSVSFSPDGKTLASGSWDGTVLLWDVSDGKVMQKFIGHTSWVNSVSFSPDGKMFASGSQDGTVILWKIPSR